MSQGFSIVGAAGQLEIGRQTIYDWQERYPEFKALVDKAKAARQAHWERELLTTTNSARVTAGLKALGGMRSPDWSDDSRIELAGAGGGPLQLAAITFAVIDKAEATGPLIEGEVVEDQQD